MITLNKSQKLYVIDNGKYVSCLGFDVLERRCNALDAELSAKGILLTVPFKRATIRRYKQYQERLELARYLHETTGWRSQSELTPQLIGLEGRRVEVVTSYGETIRFQVGRSTGFIPCHLEIARSNSSGGSAISGAPFQSVRVIR